MLDLPYVRSVVLHELSFLALDFFPVDEIDPLVSQDPLERGAFHVDRGRLLVVVPGLIERHHFDHLDAFLGVQALQRL
jgi:hypothetical protein